MAKATIHMKTGALVTIEGSKEEVATILSDFEHATVAATTKKEVIKKRLKRRDEQKRANATDLVLELKKEGFFNDPKNLKGIADELESRGYLYPTTSLSGTVLGLVRKKYLGRKKVNKKWVYGR